MSTIIEVAEYRDAVELSIIHESKLNPRQFYEPVKMAELTASVKAKGVITPLLLRPNAKGFEIAAGHRRYRAATAAGLPAVPAVIRPMDDVTFLEILIMENDEREDLQPLEEAQGYKTLILKAGYTVERIAQRRGECSTKYVYDRIKLLDLIEPLKTALREERITAGHAILLARLTPKQQEHASHPQRGGLWQHESVLHAEGEPIRPEVKAVSVRELDGWIAQHIRFDAKAVDAVLFPETATTVAAAQEQAEKIVKITFNTYIQESARDDKERTICRSSWKRADGKRGSKACDQAVVGVIVVGPDRGEAFKVCVQKEKCTAHWGAEIRERARRAAQRERNGGATSPRQPAAKVDTAAAKRRQEAEALQEKIAGTTFTRVLTALWKAAWAPTTDELRELATRTLQHSDAIGPLSTAFGHDWNGQYYDPKATKAVTSKIDTLTGPEVVRLLFLADVLVDSDLTPDLIRFAKAHKVDVPAIEKAVRAEMEKPKPATSGAAKKSTEKKRKKS